jgi:hypothetical protein
MNDAPNRMIAKAWYRRADRLMALMDALKRRLSADTLAWEAAQQRGPGLTLTGAPDPYGEARALNDRMKRTRARIERLRSRINRHLDRLLEAWDAEGKPS